MGLDFMWTSSSSFLIWIGLSISTMLCSFDILDSVLGIIVALDYATRVTNGIELCPSCRPPFWLACLIPEQNHEKRWKNRQFFFLKKWIKITLDEGDRNWSCSFKVSTSKKKLENKWLRIYGWISISDFQCLEIRFKFDQLFASN